uniref:Two-component response regulator-like protein n=1 Tax=Cucumis sativus TaxID=3659 RepID=Q8VWW2_CUCSA|nr:two-component response regulator-like protein [Cucumis sativus]
MYNKSSIVRNESPSSSKFLFNNLSLIYNFSNAPPPLPYRLIKSPLRRHCCCIFFFFFSSPPPNLLLLLLPYLPFSSYSSSQTQFPLLLVPTSIRSLFLILLLLLLDFDLPSLSSSSYAVSVYSHRTIELASEKTPPRLLLNIC